MKLSDKELNEIIIDEVFVQEEYKKDLFNLVEKLHVERMVSKDVLQSTMVKVWEISKSFIFIDVCLIIFLIKFENQMEKHKGMTRRP